MECVANFEVRSEGSVVTDEQVLRIKHPKGSYRARIQNIPRSTYATPFLLSVYLYFDAPRLDEAEDIGEELLADCLNMLALTTGLRFQRHRIRQIADADPGGGMRSILMWSDSIENADPHSFLSDELARSIERLHGFDMPPAIRRATRWYRLGVNETVPDDQFMNFWFALEIVAEFQKPTEKVNDKCPQCRSPLYCETCKTHPTHRPYAKQAIRDLLKSVDSGCDDALIDQLDKTRNSLMHGSTLREIQSSLPEPHEDIVDVLGRLVWKALIHQFPKELFDGTVIMGVPSTYVHRTLHGVAQIETIVPRYPDGDLDLRFQGTTMQVVPFGPPQSARPTVLSMTGEQHERLGRLRYSDGDHQQMCQRIYGRVKEEDGQVLSLVLATDMVRINDAVKRGDTGPWQDVFREIMESQAQPKNKG